MLHCEIKEILENNVYVLNFNGKMSKLVLEFYGINKPKVGDKLAIHENLLDKNSSEYTQPYSFMFVREIISKNIKELEDKNFILAKIENKVCLLKRVYG